MILRNQTPAWFCPPTEVTHFVFRPKNLFLYFWNSLSLNYMSIFQYCLFDVGDDDGDDGDVCLYFLQHTIFFQNIWFSFHFRKKVLFYYFLEYFFTYWMPYFIDTDFVLSLTSKVIILSLTFLCLFLKHFLWLF